MRTHELHCEVLLPRPIEDVFDFFADAANLQALTPPWLNFTITTPTPIDMREGTLIDYRLRVRGLPIRWRSRIVRWQPPFKFVDEQIKGPYRLWWHEHEFRSVPLYGDGLAAQHPAPRSDGNNGAKRLGTLAIDRVRYAVPMDWLTHSLLVRPDVERIFEYRKQELLRRFA
ncbi:MAG: SRPBCC family protein [Phycisphaerales bacterium]